MPEENSKSFFMSSQTADTPAWKVKWNNQAKGFMKEEQPFCLGSEGKIRFEDRMDVLGNPGQSLNTEKNFLLIYYYLQASALPGILRGFEVEMLNATVFWPKKLYFL